MINILQPCVYGKNRLLIYSTNTGLKLLSHFFTKLTFKTKSIAYLGLFLRIVHLLP